MTMRLVTIALLLFFISGSVHARKAGVDVRMPLVEEALRFLKAQSLKQIPEAAYLRAGAIRVCGEKFDGDGCRPSGVPIPSDDATGPAVTRAWRRIIESAMGAESIRQKRKFDKLAFQRYIMDGMVEALGDPASFYLVPSVYRKISSISPSFVGFGFRVIPDAAGLLVSAVHAGSPAERACAGVVSGSSITVAVSSTTAGVSVTATCATSGSVTM